MKEVSPNCGIYSFHPSSRGGHWQASQIPTGGRVAPQGLHLTDRAVLKFSLDPHKEKVRIFNITLISLHHNHQVPTYHISQSKDSTTLIKHKKTATAPNLMLFKQIHDATEAILNINAPHNIADAILHCC